MTSDARHEFVSHTAELAVRVYAVTPAALCEEAIRALGDALIAEAGASEDGGERTLTLEAVDRDALLVDLLNEVICLAETERWAPVSAVVERWDDCGRATVRLAGRRLAATPARIKSATHHEVRMERKGAEFTAEVVFDV
jgi:SHS2 domain-containing protein